MLKSELVEYISFITKIRKPDVKMMIESIIEGIEFSLKKERKVSITGLGVFELIKKPPAKRRNPKTGEAVMVGERNRIKFVPSGKLIDKLIDIK